MDRVGSFVIFPFNFVFVTRLNSIDYKVVAGE